MFLIQQPSMQWVSPLQNTPVQKGALYFGNPNKDPKVPAERITIYYYDLLGNVAELPQPVQLSNSGVPVYLGNPVEIYTNEACSIRVDDRNGNLVYLIDDYTVAVGANAAVQAVESVAALRQLPGMYGGQQVSLASYYTGLNKGGGPLAWDASSTAPDDDVVTFAVAGVAIGRWVRPIEGELWDTQAGSYNNMTNDDSAAVQSCIDTLSALGGGIVRLSQEVLLSGVEILSNGVAIIGLGKNGTLVKYIGNPAGGSGHCKTVLVSR